MKDLTLFFYLSTTLFLTFAEFPSYGHSLGGVESAYTSLLFARMNTKDDGFRDAVQPDTHGMGFVCFKDPKDDFYIGAGQFQTIDAPMALVAKVLTDFETYPQWTDGLVGSNAKKIESDLYLVSTEQEIPIPLVSNIHTQLLYEVKTGKDQVTLRYQLKTSDSLTAYDGLIILEALGPQKTRFTEYDILNADWGVAKAMGAKKLWSDSLKAMYQGDLALKMQLEAPEVPLKEILKKSLKIAEQQDFTSCFDARREFKPAP